MNKTATAIILILLSTSIFQLSSLATANPLIEERYDSPPKIIINSPENGTYVNSVLLNVIVTKSENWLDTPISFSYEPDGGLSQRLVTVSFYVDGKVYGSVSPNSDLSSPFSYSLQLENLSDGSHILLVRADSTGVVRDWISDTVYEVPAESATAAANFTLDSPPEVSFLSTAKAYTTPEFPLIFTVNEHVAKISYVLDGQENVTIYGNTTLTRSTFGTHNVTVYAWDIVGNAGTSETITFTIAEPFSIPMTIAIVVLVAIGTIALIVAICSGLLVYYKKSRKGKTQ
jgi:hypothetical protein